MNPVYVENDKVAKLLQVFLEGGEIEVQTKVRKFSGKVEGVYRSPYSDLLRGTVSDSEGRVHNFYPEKVDCQIS